MPFRDPERARQAKREWARRRRAAMASGSGRSVDPAGSSFQSTLPLDFRIQKARDVLSVLNDSLAGVRADPAAWRLSQARVIVLLAGTSLRVIECGDLERRIEELEKAYGNGKTSSAEDAESEPAERAA